jgi:CopG family transcriptional regulator, nickel-responsive regulator
MKDPLVRFGVALEGSLLRDLDAVVRQRGGTRSELLRDLARAEVGRAKVPKAVDAIATLTLVYDHHVRDLSERLTDLQHELGEQVRATLHVHINHDLCLEVIVIRGRSDRLQGIADRLLALRGVKQGGIEIVAGLGEAGHDHSHFRSHFSEDEIEPSSASVPARGGHRAGRAKSATSGSPARRHHRGHSHGG